MQVVRSVKKSCQAYLASVMDASKINLTFVDVKVVRYFVDIFLKDLPDLPLEHEVEFLIDLLLGSTLISKTTYCMKPTKLKELKT